MAHAIRINLDGNPNIGLYGLATDKFCIIGKNLAKKNIAKIEETLKVPVYQLNLYGTNLIGIFAVGNSNGILIPNIVFESELEELKKLPIKFTIIKTEKTALNNNILCNDKVAFVSKDYSKKEVEQIKDALKVKIIQMDIAGTNLPGSNAVLTNKGALFNQNTSESDIQKIEKELGFEIGLGTVSMGNNMISSGLIANSNGFVAGELTSGHELVRIDESLRLSDS